MSRPAWKYAGVWGVCGILILVAWAGAQAPEEGQGRGQGRGGPPPGRGPRGKGMGLGKGQAQGKGQGFGKGQGHGQANDPRFIEDRDTFHALLDAREQIRRAVTDLPDGVETLTESDDPAVQALIRRHVAAMHDRLLESRPIHRRDPLFAAIFDHAEQIDWKCESTEKGVRVRETSKDPHVAKLIQAHAQVVSSFLKHGHAEVMKNHEPPPRPPAPPPGQAPAPTAPAPMPPPGLSAAQTAQFQKAVAVRDQAFAAFLARLQEAQNQGGTDRAIDACKDVAPQLTRELAAETGVKFGRTSWKLRNPANLPPEWARQAIRDRLAKPAAFPLDGERLGVLLPIKLRQDCVACHGKPADLSQPVMHALARLYPNDQATGFAVDDLRGWFWLEVPPMNQ